MADRSAAQLEEQLAHLDELDDPLAVFDTYHSHLVNSHAPLSSITKLLERATQAFVDDRRYRNDPRYLRLWLAYARRCREPEDIFAFLALHCIATELAAYYEEYAMYVERRQEGDLTKAQAILHAGIERGAKPLERLRKSYQEFLLRHGLGQAPNPINANVSDAQVLLAHTLPSQKSTSHVDNDREHDLLPTPWTGDQHKAKPIQTRGYRADLVYKEGMEGEGEFSFEEVRAKAWRGAGTILKNALRAPSSGNGNFPQPNNNNPMNDDDDDDLAFAHSTLGPINPDDLTHVSIYKDNTADIRELARSLAKAEEEEEERREERKKRDQKAFEDWQGEGNQTGFQNSKEQINPSNNVLLHSPSKGDPLLKAQGLSPEWLLSSIEPSLNDNRDHHKSSPSPQPRNVENKYYQDRPETPGRSARLSLIPEESDAATQISGFISSLLKEHSANPLSNRTLSIISPTHPNPHHPHLYSQPSDRHHLSQAQLAAPHNQVRPGQIIGCQEALLPKLAALAPSFGRDGVGRNNTIASLKSACGLYFIERRLASHTLLAVDLSEENDHEISNDDLHQCVLKTVDTAWQAHILLRISQSKPPISAFPILLGKGARIARYLDCFLFAQTFYPHSSLAVLGRRMAAPLEEKLILFWLRDLTISLRHLHSIGIIHGSVTLDHLLLRLGFSPASATFDLAGGGGWADRGIALVGYALSIDLATLSPLPLPSAKEALLDTQAHLPYMEALGKMAPNQLCALDVFGLAGCLEGLLERHPLGSRKYQDLWSRISQIITKALQEATWEGIQRMYAVLQKMLDERLLLEAPVLPTLKSMLTRLEISLLEMG